MKAKPETKVRYVVQNKSVYHPSDPLWREYSGYVDLKDAEHAFSILCKVNPHVRIIKRTITEEVIQESI